MPLSEARPFQVDAARLAYEAFITTVCPSVDYIPWERLPIDVKEGWYQAALAAGSKITEYMR
jgi:hypothetical protein